MQDANSTGGDSGSTAENTAEYPFRPHVIVEFIEGDLNKPIIYPNGGSLERDEAIRAEFEKRWGNS